MEKLFHELDEKISIFKRESGLECVRGCGKCCFKNDVEATILEFLPLAFHYFKSGKAEELYKGLSENVVPVCVLLSTVVGSLNTGFCSEYQYRGMICRLFGFSARMNKTAKPELFICRTIKENQPDEYASASLRINTGLKIPVTSDYYMKLRTIDPELGGRTYPINDAIRRAFEIVMNYYYFRNAGGTRYRKSS